MAATTRRAPSPTPTTFDEPPPSYEETQHQGPVLQSGPRRPFGFSDHPVPPQQQPFAPPPMPSRPQHTAASSSSFNGSFYGSPAPSAPLSLPPRRPSQPMGPGSMDGDEDRGPTTVPMPGRVLMHQGKVLSYPSGYTCPKCSNVGFKGSNPTRPCRKCWEKYGKPWNVIRHAPDAGNISQRPLGPQPSSVYLNSGYPPNGSSNGFASPQPFHVPPPQQQSSWQHSPSPYQTPYAPYPQPSYSPFPPSQRGPATSPPLVVRPGDPRIGGQLCTVCGGGGRVGRSGGLGAFMDYMLGGPDSEVCPACRGAGRVF